MSVGEWGAKKTNSVEKVGAWGGREGIPRSCGEAEFPELGGHMVWSTHCLVHTGQWIDQNPPLTCHEAGPVLLALQGAEAGPRGGVAADRDDSYGQPAAVIVHSSSG